MADKGRRRSDVALEAPARRVKQQPSRKTPRQPLPTKIFHFTEIRNCGINRNSPAYGRGAVRESFETRAGLRWTRQRRVRRVRAGRIALREPEASYGRAALRTRVRQNRVVLAVVATVKLLRRRQSRQPARCPRISRGRGRPERTRLPGERGISRQPT